VSGFATFWSGPLPALVRACLASFPAAGARLALYAYEPFPDLPAGVEARDAREICADLRELYPVAGRPSLAHFSDRFRYEMLARADFCWVDADIVALRPEALDGDVVWGRQAEAKGKALINNAVLRLPPDDPVLADMLARARAVEGQDIDWGAIGPYLLTEVAEAHGVYGSAAPPERYFPIAPDEFWRLFDPASRDAVAEIVRDADLIHLWSELLRRVGYDFDAAPPAASYLNELFDDFGALDLFGRVCDAQEIAAMIARWNASAPKETP
jgi:hypothetical protein